MLRRIEIRDFVIVEQAVLDFETGFTVLTGETGAGKSILIDALGLLLGERSDAGMVRPGAKQAEVSAEFDFGAERGELARWLADAGLEGDRGVCLVRRSLEAAGRSRAFINGHAAPVAQLRELGEMLVDVHGQHAHQSLLRPAAQRMLLDGYAGASALAGEVRERHQSWSELTERHQRALNDAERLAREREELGWKVEELQRLQFTPQGWSELNGEHARLAHAASLIETASASIDSLGEGEQAAAASLAAALQRLGRAAEIDVSLAPVLEMVQAARIQIDEAVHALERYRSRLEVDPGRLAEVESRLQAVHDACRKFRLTPQALAEALELAQNRLAELELDLDLTRLERETAAAREAYRSRAGRLTDARRKAAAQLSREVTRAIRDLALAGARFDVALEPLTEPAAAGMERIEFRVATHSGAQPAPLGRVASGGELSRLSLAIQTVLSQVAEVPTLIFDEVDAGIGGRVAEIVGKMLHRLAGRHQVMCVTHLPQVAACADQHWRVAKEEHKGGVVSRVDALRGSQRVEEIARMLGGIRITKASREHAAELLHEAQRAREQQEATRA
jgi:DNA repair protein RecN (Recombination protein N)